MTDLLREKPELLSVEVLRRARLKGYEGAKSALYGLVRLVRPVPVRPLVRFEGLPGEFTQHDFGEVDVRFLDGTRKRVHFFASRLKYSRWVEVSLVEDERVENLVRSMVSHFESMGGIPLLAVFDRPKTVALKWRHSGDVTDWNPTFAAVAFELGLGIELCWPHSPEQKGSVESGGLGEGVLLDRQFVLRPRGSAEPAAGVAGRGKHAATVTSHPGNPVRSDRAGAGPAAPAARAVG